jgi:hypothetical protein
MKEQDRSKFLILSPLYFLIAKTFHICIEYLSTGDNKKPRMLLSGMCALDNRISAQPGVQESPFFLSVAQTALPIGLDNRAPFVGALLPRRNEMSKSSSVRFEDVNKSPAKGALRGARKSNSSLADDISLKNAALVLSTETDDADADDHRISRAKQTTMPATGTTKNVKSLRIARGRSLAAQ